MSDPQQQVSEHKQLAAWQRQLLPFMMYGLAGITLIFFLGTFWNYHSLNETLRHEDPPISESVEKATTILKEVQFADWYVRAVLEERALAGRQRQYNAIVQSRLWTRLMGFLTGMVMVLAGSVFILGKLDAEFDGSAKLPQGEGAFKTNSPGLVLVVGGTILLVISLVVTVDVASEDRLVYLPAFEQVARPPTGELAPAPTAEEPPDTLAERTANWCAQAKNPPPDCKPRQ